MFPKSFYSVGDKQCHMKVLQWENFDNMFEHILILLVNLSRRNIHDNNYSIKPNFCCSNLPPFMFFISSIFSIIYSLDVFVFRTGWKKISLCCGIFLFFIYLVHKVLFQLPEITQRPRDSFSWNNKTFIRLHFSGLNVSFINNQSGPFLSLTSYKASRVEWSASDTRNIRSQKGIIFPLKQSECSPVTFYLFTIVNVFWPFRRFDGISSISELCCSLFDVSVEMLHFQLIISIR